MKSITSYIIEKYKISKNTINDSKKLYIFIPYGWTYDFFEDNFNKDYHKLTIYNFKDSDEYDIYYLTKDEIFICLDNKPSKCRYVIYEFKDNEYNYIYDEHELADIIHGYIHLDDLILINVKNNKFKQVNN